MVWLFDVDGTLVGSVRSDRLRPGAQELLNELDGRGVTCVLWSAGGAAYARRMAQQHGIVGFFDGFYAKLERDDADRYGVDHLEPRHRPDVLVDDSPLDLPSIGTIVGVPQFIGSNASDRALLDVHADLDRLLAT